MYMYCTVLLPLANDPRRRSLGPDPSCAPRFTVTRLVPDTCLRLPLGFDRMMRALTLCAQSRSTFFARHATPQIAMYHEIVIDHYENPRNVGSLDKSDPNVGTGLVGAPACGDVMKLQIKVGDDGTVEETKFKTFGCGSAIASSSLATDWIKGKHVDEIVTIKNQDIAKHLKLPPVKLHCSMLAEDAIKAAVKDWKHKKEASAADS